MADNFFDGTLDDFLDDQDFFELAGLALPSGSPPRYGLGLGLDAGLSVREAPSDVPGAAGPGPTRPQRPTPAALPPRPSFLASTASPGTIENPTPASFLPDYLTRRPVVSAPSDPSRNLFASTLPLHGLPSLSAAASNPRQRNHSGNFPSQTRLRDLSRTFPQRRILHRGYTSDIATTVHFAPAAGFLGRSAIEIANSDHDSDNTPIASPTMSSDTRRGSLRPTDLTMPAVPSQAGPSSRAAPRITRRSASRPLQPEKNSPTTTTTTKRKREQDDDDDLFGDSTFAGQQIVDLVDKDEVPADLLNSQDRNKNYVRLSRFDCVICMDNVKDLTVTHCGHLFCSECLHSALNMDLTRRICPICRQKIDKMNPSGKFGQRAKGFYPLELQLVTRKTLGESSDGAV